MNAVEISPIVKCIEVRRPAEEAFRLFTEQIGSWWPTKTHSLARNSEGESTENVTIEPRVGGRVFETLNDGRKLPWGTVTAYEPGDLFAMDWQMGRPSEQATQATVRFEPIGEQQCRVTLTHENWQRLGEEAERMRHDYNNGWVTVFEECFGAFAGKG